MHTLAIIAILSAISVDQVLGQISSNVTCSAATAWMQNSLGQNPCLVSAYLSGACDGGDWSVPTLDGDGPYNPPDNNALNNPNTTGATVCRCNTVVYNLLQACSVCQGGIIGTWGDWIEFCPSSNVHTTFPETVPVGTIIPGWATLDPTTTGTWNATQAQQYALGHSSGSSTPTPSSSSSHKSSDTGAIVGGVVGGIVGLILLGLAIFFFLRYRSAGKGEKVTPIGYSGGGGFDSGYSQNGEKEGPNRVDMGTPAPYMYGMSTPSGFRSSVDNSTTPLRPYDPSDPSTFPTSTSPAPTSTYVSHDPNQSGTSDFGGYSGHQQTYPPYQAGSPKPFGADASMGSRPSAPGGYTGAAEV